MYAKHAQGRISPQAHAQVPEGTYEEHHARQGFEGEVSQLYHAHPTTDWLRVEGPVRPRGIQLTEVRTADEHDARALPTPLLYNDDLTLSVSRRTAPMPYYLRNADGDTLLLTQSGSGTLVTDYGTLNYGPLEYLVIPKGTNHRVVPDAAGGPHVIYVVETREPLTLPERGPLGHFLPFDRGVLDVPRLDARATVPSARNADGEWEVLVKRDGRLSSIFYAFDPADVQGWTGTLAPFRLRLADIRPVTSERLDVPPMTHATFQAGKNWIVTMAPRPTQTADDAERVQPYHRNVDYDEVIVPLGTGDGRSAGSPTGLAGITPGGMNHGPGRARLAANRDRLPIYVWNIDTIRPLRYTDAFEAHEIPDFARHESYRG
ncbi:MULTISPECIES: homogentisate 1,2-dioxygenase [Streptomyces]|uniref:homogentisate 1,2-dioxygenase n=1 Tax=Streptomyces TaxID=1883 RepID=UPI00163C1813|nr:MULTISPECIES: homogentisate 1,2-dioxygenase [Streptomyces]MBC2874681.1 homogentisate 1,2-dioxygenase [Streptomyces sp. TYQ1024]UBI36556.1 homogentisate 1,2-dioxygenase [Streptomyces mobaraensis]UKW29147.1 homogentisate 1,2-dioxygenase [Streptomyces sp. TYQ1024]